MATIVVMPQLGNSVESCIIVEWMIAEGDTVSVDQTLASIETDKSTMEVPSTAEGTVLKLLWEEGDEVPVKDPLIIVGEPGEDISGLVPGGDAAPAEADAPAEQAAAAPEAAAPAFATERATGAVSPRARALAASNGVDASAIAEGSGPHGRVIERDVAAAIAAGPVLTSAARAAGVSAAEGTGIGGRVSVADAGRTAEAAPAAAVAAPAAAADFPGASTSAPLKGVRKVVAKRMMESLTSTAQLTLNTTANAAGILAMRKKVKNADEALGLNKITLNDLVCFAVSRTLLKYPVFNAHLEDGVLTEFEQVHLGFACDTPRGLLVPVIRSAQALGLKAFSDEAKRLAGGAIDGSLSPDFLSGGTFTVSNIGSFGIETFTPVINLPQTAILGVGAITPRPTVAADGSIGVEQRLNLSLTIDHQVIDGADGARFLRDLVAAIENIDVTVLA
ncbi:MULTISPECIES: dihydrolipoamide acetyltransferase family protein [Actinomycetes]|uniref:dihydrolipoamide acetyltransferase family protein n=1 Tax=Actinomycetes TaxID=1760 RepID=UPI00044536D9|nr:MULTISPECIES: dihydrolipoamide acetyltransferase family protein [Actinomycetes]EWC94952.1 putative TPP-dependent acetoin dehydrogenase complex, E2 component, dihydrolipoyllysine-residue acetyltransferase [Actinomyces sp. ICM54]MCQ5273050.1 2-oxo acid dehydrogenase subunit E2 [Schaalia odontolytica]MCQ5282394.1 2-oxo acid dehydrogenase subunit E2 [Schaalia odontolytica]